MNSKALLSIAALVVAVVLAVFFPKLTGSGDAPSLAGDSSRAATATSTRAADPAPSRGPLDESSTESTPARPDASASRPSASRPTAPKANQQGPGARPASEPQSPAAKPASGPNANVGFGSRQAFDDHFAKHGSEFGSITPAQYLALAQALRDAPVGGAVLEAVRDDGVISRFDKKSGAFIAFNRNQTIRTFFKPNDGVRYFERQIEKAH